MVNRIPIRMVNRIPILEKLLYSFRKLIQERGNEKKCTKKYKLLKDKDIEKQWGQVFTFDIQTIIH
jgi:hypothetical protein